MFSITLWNFQSQQTTNAEITVAWKLYAHTSSVVDTSDIDCMWHTVCMVYCCDNVVPGLSLGVIIVTVNTIQSRDWLQRLSHSTIRVCPKGLTVSCFNENGFDCSRIIINCLCISSKIICLRLGLWSSWGTHQRFTVIIVSIHQCEILILNQPLSKHLEISLLFVRFNSKCIC